MPARPSILIVLAAALLLVASAALAAPPARAALQDATPLAFLPFAASSPSAPACAAAGLPSFLSPAQPLQTDGCGS